ncbi:FxLYD domain-containing protein [Halorubrum tropicale]|uniref:Uncharacterized protein n=1 Tax=Halorubrum tropicale TaxID=1765655 RepID=A0A0M9AKV3_9EURY|nr:FxLYD domain-containing protein [Halorubrum tropicale]KOX92701.1 hypothetical protein AMR74_16870 [Halorubrum tropicale]
MNRRAYVALGTTALAALSGCVGSSTGEDGGEAGAGGDAASDDVPELDVGGEHLADLSHPDAELATHAFEYVGESTQPWAVVGTASHTQEARADLQVSVNFIDEGNTIIRDSYDLITDVASDQSAEFIVEYAGDDPERVSKYEIVVDVR